MLGTTQMSEVYWDWLEDSMGACSKAAAHALCHQLDGSFDVSPKKQKIQNSVQNCPSSKILFNSLILNWGWRCGPSLHIPELNLLFSETHKHYMLCWILGLEGQWNGGQEEPEDLLCWRGTIPHWRKARTQHNFFIFISWWKKQRKHSREGASCK